MSVLLQTPSGIFTDYVFFSIDYIFFVCLICYYNCKKDSASIIQMMQILFYSVSDFLGFLSAFCQLTYIFFNIWFKYQPYQLLANIWTFWHAQNGLIKGGQSTWCQFPNLPTVFTIFTLYHQPYKIKTHIKTIYHTQNIKLFLFDNILKTLQTLLSFYVFVSGVSFTQTCLFIHQADITGQTFGIITIFFLCF